VEDHFHYFGVFNGGILNKFKKIERISKKSLKIRRKKIFINILFNSYIDFVLNMQY
jgi:hypothetical protein